MGGSSAINGLSFVRGHRSSYDAWVGQGAEGWGFDDLLPYFKRSEHVEGGDASLRGFEGPMTVAPVQDPSPLSEAGVNAAVDFGLKRTANIGGGLEMGVGFADNSIFKGARLSVADAYLRPVADRPNLDIVTDAQAHRVRVRRGQCIGVEYASGDTLTSVDCSREVVLTAGTFGSAQLLLLSGIGPAEHLRELGIDVVLDLPGVGANLHDHPMSSLIYRARKPVPVIESNPLAETAALFSSETTRTTPDLQVLFAVVPIHAPELTGPAPGNGYSILFAAIDPHSRGTLRLASSDPSALPLLDTNYYGDERDIATMVKGLELARVIGESEALAEWREAEVLPGPAVTGADDVRDYLLKRNLFAYFHYAGTCRIGNDDMAVVDRELRVHGIKGLRVADASVMPSVPTANTNATVCAIGERAADLLENHN
jgi:choline dehydrogenase